MLLDGVLLGILNNDDGGDGNGNENVKKTIGLWGKTTILHMYHAFLPSLHDYDVKMPNYTFYGGREQGTTNFSFSF